MVDFPQNDNRLSGASDLWDNDNASIILLSDYFVEPVSAITRLKVWLGSSWIEKPTKVWNGTSWVERQVKFYNGSSFSNA